MFKTIIASLLSVAVASPMGNSIDPSTYGNIEAARTTNLELDLTVDFNNRLVQGVATHTVSLQGRPDSVWFDVAGIDLHGVEWSNTYAQQWQEAEYFVTTPNPNIGSAIEVKLTTFLNPYAEDVLIRFLYTTNKNTTSISWMTPQQTHDKKMPYMYTQCESIACRSLAPMQDTPANKILYSAKIRAPNDFQVYMSANKIGSTAFNSTFNETSFSSDVVIPSYLIALVVGDLEYQKIGNTTGVITEPGFMPAVASEFSGMQTQLDTIQAYLERTPYPWKHYNILVLPPSFPFGGMENPLVTFASPTVVIGDKSQVYVAAHEMIHSWTGNSVTCANWANFWVNEGFTVFIERKVSETLKGHDFAMVEAYIGNHSIYENIQQFGYWNSYSSLNPNVRNNNPDDSFSEIPYEKGFQFIYYLQSLLGEFHTQQLIDEYVQENLFTSVQWEVFQKKVDSFLNERWPKDEADDVRRKIDWDNWVYGPGLAPVWQDFTTPMLNSSQALARAYIDGRGKVSPPGFQDYNDDTKYYSNLRVIFMMELMKNSDMLTKDILEKIDTDLNITDHMPMDYEILSRWIPLGIKFGYHPILFKAQTITANVGRLIYLSPIYRELVANGQVELAKQWYSDNESFYAPAARVTLSKIINANQDQ